MPPLAQHGPLLARNAKKNGGGSRGGGVLPPRHRRLGWQRVGGAGSSRRRGKEGEGGGVLEQAIERRGVGILRTKGIAEALLLAGVM